MFGFLPPSLPNRAWISPPASTSASPPPANVRAPISCAFSASPLPCASPMPHESAARVPSSPALGISKPAGTREANHSAAVDGGVRFYCQQTCVSKLYIVSWGLSRIDTRVFGCIPALALIMGLLRPPTRRAAPREACPSGALEPPPPPACGVCNTPPAHVALRAK